MTPLISLVKWMIAGLEISRILSSFDETLNDYGESTELYSHYKNTASFKNMFEKDFKNLKYEFEKVGNTFFEDTEMLYALVTKNATSISANKSIHEARTLGERERERERERDLCSCKSCLPSIIVN